MLAMLLSTFVVFSPLEPTSFAMDSEGNVLIDDAEFHPVDDPSDFCKATYQFVEQVIVAFTKTPELKAMYETSAFQNVIDAMNELEQSDCEPSGIEPSPNDSPNCALLRYNVKQAETAFYATPEFEAARALPHVMRARDAVLNGVEDGCYEGGIF